MSDQETDVRITRVILSNFKGFSNYSLKVEPMTMLVGPNNSGKSTIVGAFRALSVALRTARARRSEILQAGEHSQRGYRIPTDGMPISLENARHDYSDRDATAEFKLSNGRALTLIFSADGLCSLVVHADGPVVRSVANFKRHFPIDVGVVPVLGPVEHNEQLVEEQTVQRNLQTHRASRNFRSYWYYRGSEEFEELRESVRESWTDIDIQMPKISPGADKGTLVYMMCTENRITRELYWMGFGFQVWLQIMTHVLRARESTVLVVDEPETYLHPALQQDLLKSLREVESDCLLATHSSELVGEAERSEIVLVDKTQRSGKRLETGTHTDALGVLGSRFNFALTDVLRQRKALLVEGDSDLKHLKRLRSRLNPPLRGGMRIPPVMPLGGHRRERARDLAQAMETLVGSDVRLAVVLDRDYRADEEVEKIESELRADFDIAHVFRKKEIENYFLIPSVIAKAARAERDDSGRINEADVAALLRAVTDGLHATTQSQCLTKYVDFGGQARPEVDRATLSAEALERFRVRWETLETRLDMVPGKDVLRGLNSALRREGYKAVTIPQLANQMTADDVPPEMTTLLRQLDRLIAS